MGLSTKRFDELTQAHLDPLLVDRHGFTFLRGAYYRDLASRVRHVLIIDYAPGRGRFFTIAGLNSDVLSGDRPADEAGAYATRHVSPGGFSDRQAPFPARDQASAAASLARLVSALQESVVPWFDRIRRLSDVATALPDEFDIFKGELFLEDGQREDARVWLVRYQERMRRLDRTAEVSAALQKVEALLHRGRA